MIDLLKITLPMINNHLERPQTARQSTMAYYDVLGMDKGVEDYLLC